ncbi:r2 protein [Lasius niger]|uniref:R2 protein n=1 Tax=Lasius niger TaxID=67767 RepID=A0A0J7KQ02_LASNI|nr:r2 protein [Lasius niger]
MKADEGGIITIVDIAKAFDTVPHSAIHRSLCEKGIPTSLANYVREMYSGCKTRIKARNDKAIEIELKRGVKQGDSLSPLLFNLTIDPIIEDINKNTTGIKIQEENLSILAFADDVVLLAKDKLEAKRQIKKLYIFLKNLGMELSINKCSTFEIKSAHKTWYMRDPGIMVQNQPIPYSGPEQAIAYLGARLKPWSGFQKEANAETIIKAVANAGSLKLKPHQKINLIRTYLLPRFIHELIASPPPTWALIKINHEIKQTIKRILHLHPSTTDGLIYSSKSHGGLGILRIEIIVKLASLRSSIKLKNSEDPVLREAIDELEGRYRKYATSLQIPWSSTLEQIEEARKKIKRSETEKWEQLVSQGQGVREFRKDKIGNAWLYDPSLLKLSRFLDALRLRTNTFGVRVALRRANPDINHICRRCAGQPETLRHFLGNCTHTKPQRIRRHDEIKNLLAHKLARTYAVFIEPTVKVANELKKPDLVVIDQERLYVIEVTVRYEDRNSIKDAFKEKSDKYTETADFIKRRLGCQSAEVLPIVVGSRGAMPAQTQANLKKLGCTKSEMKTISLIALRSSIEIANAFIDYD